MITLIIETSEFEFYQLDKQLLKAGYSIECTSFKKVNNKVHVELILQERGQHDE